MRVSVELAFEGEEICRANNAASVEMKVTGVPDEEFERHLGGIELTEGNAAAWKALVLAYESAKAGKLGPSRLRIAQAKARVMQLVADRAQSERWQKIIDGLGRFDRAPKREKEKRVVATLEAEAMPEHTQAQIVSRSGASGGKAIEMAHTTGRVSQKLKLDPGVYAIDVRGLGPAPMSDAIFVEIETVGVRRTYFPKPEWCQASTVWFEVENGGEYRLSVLCAEVKAIVDRLVVTKHE